MNKQLTNQSPGYSGRKSSRKSKLFILCELGRKWLRWKRETEQGADYFFLKNSGIDIPLLALFVLRLRLGLLLHGFEFGWLFHGLELVQEGFIADLEDLGGLTPVPARLRQDPFNRFALRLHGGAPANLQQGRHFQLGRAIAFVLRRGNGSGCRGRPRRERS